MQDNTCDHVLSKLTLIAKINVEKQKNAKVVTVVNTLNVKRSDERTAYAVGMMEKHKEYELDVKEKHKGFELDMKEKHKESELDMKEKRNEYEVGTKEKQHESLKFSIAVQEYGDHMEIHVPPELGANPKRIPPKRNKRGGIGKTKRKFRIIIFMILLLLLLLPL